MGRPSLSRARFRRRHQWLDTLRPYPMGQRAISERIASIGRSGDWPIDDRPRSLSRGQSQCSREVTH
jgi:hypothetical protein